MPRRDAPDAPDAPGRFGAEANEREMTPHRGGMPLETPRGGRRRIAGSGLVDYWCVG